MHETYQSAWHMQESNGKTCWDDLHPSEKLPTLKRRRIQMGGRIRSTTFVLLRRVDLVRRSVRVYFYFHCHRLDSHLPLRDLLEWPLAPPNDGSIDIATQEPASVSSLVGLMDVAPQVLV